jgi:multidrug transporter EmrE-like cation transporter
VALQAFLLLLIAIAMSTTGELLLKHGMNMVGVLHLNPTLFIPTLAKAFTNPFVLAGFALIFGGSIFWLAVLSRVDLSWAYPMLSLGYIIVVVESWILLNEPVTPLRFIGVLVICLGVFIVSRS